jgi:DNA-directed RNA polymerase subunit RPC12/RpoP
MPTEPQKKKGLPCPRCGNRLRVRADQIDSEVMCPKCGSTFVVARPGARPPAGDRSDDDLYEPELPLAPSTVPPEALTDLSPSANRQAGYDVDWNTDDDFEVEAPHVRPPSEEPDYLAQAHTRGFVRDEAPIEPPRWTFFSGVFDFPWRASNLARWVAISFGLVMTGEAFVVAVSLMSGSTLAMPIVAMVTAMICLLSFSFLAPCFVATIQDTTDGVDEIQETTMPDWDQWFFSMLSLLNVVVLSGVIGVPLTFVEPIGPAAIPIAAFCFFPILVLSALEAESFLMPFSPLVWASLWRLAPAWLMLYVLSALLLGGWFVITGLTIGLAPYLMVLPLALALSSVLLIYARLIGRMGWLITGGLPAVSKRGPASPAKRSSRRGKRRARVLPEDLDSAAHLVADEATPIPANKRIR